MLALAVLHGRASGDDPAPQRPLTPVAARTIDFADDVFPILKSRCFECHQGSDASSGHRLDSREDLLGETTGVPLVAVGRNESSKLIRLVTQATGDGKMPPEGPRLTDVQVAILKAWIDEGLSWDDRLVPPPYTSALTHWAFRPITRPAVPTNQRPDTLSSSPLPSPLRGEGPGVRGNPLDAFLRAKQLELGIASPAPRANQIVLARRLWLDLTGLPPSHDELTEFLDDDRPDAFERLTDRLLSSPHYGERWGRHWLDVARFAETEGYESNHPRSSAWRYRDYVVAAFNSNKSFDRFLTEQLAGDELQPYSDENLIATGFLAAARISSNEEDKWLQRNAVLVDIVNTTGSAFLGLTLSCAQCHNHKFDPITIRDYYRLHGYFVRGQPQPFALKEVAPESPSDTRRIAEYQAAVALKQSLFEAARQHKTEAALQAQSPEAVRAFQTPFDQRTIEQERLARQVSLKTQFANGEIEKAIPEADRKLYDELKRKLGELEKPAPPVPQTFAFVAPSTSPHELKPLPALGFYALPFVPDEMAHYQPYLMIRGEVHGLGPKLQPGTPAIFDAVMTKGTDSSSNYSRQTLAAWLTDSQHPLTARVWANRLWHHHFGRGIVATPDDFGLKGAPPSHPELLDWLASELLASGWDTKHLHRLMVTSLAYQRAASLEATPVPSPPSSGERARVRGEDGGTPLTNANLDPDNITLWRWNTRRLDAEVIRDAMLAATDELDSTLGGRSVAQTDSPASRRRSVYLFQKRGATPEMQQVFDGPSEAAESCPARHTTTTPIQSLYLLNNPFAFSRAQSLAARVEREAGSTPREQIDRAFRLTLNRAPDAEELAESTAFLVERPAAEPSNSTPTTNERATRLVLFCHTLLNLNEFVYLP